MNAACGVAVRTMSQFIRIGESLVNLELVRAIEYAGDGRMNVWLSEDRATGLVLRYSGEEAREAWDALTKHGAIPVINAHPPVP
jgi:hypothetical protein